MDVICLCSASKACKRAGYVKNISRERETSGTRSLTCATAISGGGQGEQIVLRPGKSHACRKE